MKKKTGVLLVNLGTPKSFKEKDVFCYLSEFLTDKRVLGFSWLRRFFLANGCIIPLRYKQSARQYRTLWTDKGSPLLVHSQEIKQSLQEVLGDSYRVILAMRYQHPSIQEALEDFRKEPVDELIIVPLFPQYASATTGSIYQKVMECIKDWFVFPKLKFIDHFFDHPAVIDAYCARAGQYSLLTYDHVLFSFHGLPESQIQSADVSGECLSKHCCQNLCEKNRFCYKTQCYATAHAIASKLALKEGGYTICFQSRLGKQPWIQPYFSDVLKHRAALGNKRLLVFSPSFVCDCLETTYEIGIEYNREFQRLGGIELQLVEGLNNHPFWIEALRCIVLND